MVEICVVSCCSCQTFQGQQVKKEKKWTCKMCGEKQSFQKIFAQGSGKECRLHVQKLNMMKGHMDKQKDEELRPINEEMKEMVEPLNQQNSATGIVSESKWQQFVSQQQPDSQENGNESDKESCFTTERAIFKKHKNQKRKKGNLSSEQGLQKYPEKIQKMYTSASNNEGSSSPGWLNKAETDIYSKDYIKTKSNDIDQLLENQVKLEFREDNKFLKRSATSSRSDCSQTISSKWSKFT